MNTMENIERPAVGPEMPPVIDGAEISVPLRPPEPPPLPAPPTKNRRRLITTAALLCLAAVAFWQRQSLYPLLQRSTPYVPVAIPVLIALHQIVFKDWNNYKPRWVRHILLVFVLSSLGWGILYQGQQIRLKASASARADAAEKAQAENTRQFLGSLQVLTDKVSDLQTKVATEALQEELATVKDELKRTQQALVPAPKAVLAFSFPGYKNPKVGESFVPVREMTVRATADGVIKIPVVIVNNSEVDALEGHINLFICDDCRYASEPAGTARIDDLMPEQARDYPFPQILAADALLGPVLEVKLLKHFSDVKIAVQHRCRTCVLEREAVKGTIKIIWP